MIKNVHGNTVDLLGEDIVSGRYAVGAALPLAGPATSSPAVSAVASPPAYSRGLNERDISSPLMQWNRSPRPVHDPATTTLAGTSDSRSGEPATRHTGHGFPVSWRGDSGRSGFSQTPRTTLVP